jgi:adenylate kinase family enzyme
MKGGNLRRVVVLGCSGSGKSIFARRLRLQLGLPVVHLDVLYWRRGWKEPDTGSFRARVADAIAGESWVREGNYRETFDLRLPRANAVIILDAPRWLRLIRVLRRSVYSGRGPDLPEGCPEHFDWKLLKFIWRFDKVTWPRIEAARVEHGPDLPVIRLRNNREVAAFLASIKG